MLEIIRIAKLALKPEITKKSNITEKFKITRNSAKTQNSLNVFCNYPKFLEKDLEKAFDRIQREDILKKREV